MSVAYQPGQTLIQDDLKIVIRDNVGNLVDPYYIRYSIFDYTTGVEVLIGAPDQVPATVGTGQYYVSTTIPLDSNIGDWLVRWNFRETSGSPTVQVVQEFNVVAKDVKTDITSVSSEQLLISRLRIILRDNNPDRNYRFRPPASEKFLQTQAKVFGYVWEDYELYEYLLMAVDFFNTAPPVTGISLTQTPDRWRAVVLLKAASLACGALALNWIVDEYSYSISALSLDIEKSSKYQSMKDSFETEYDKILEQAKRSIKIAIGLKQPRYGIGISSALGPYSRPGVQSRRNFVSGFRGGWS
jgi:hypothetical protein